MQINRFCASGLDAVNLAAAQVMTGMKDVAIGGGVESMSRVGMGASAAPGRSIRGSRSPATSCRRASPPTSSRRSTASRATTSTPRRSVAKARRGGLGRRALRQVRGAGEGRQRPDHSRQGRAHAAADRHAVARTIEGELRPDGRARRLRCGRDRRASRCREHRPRPPCRQFVGHRRRRRRGPRRLARRAGRRRASSRAPACGRSPRSAPTSPSCSPARST